VLGKTEQNNKKVTTDYYLRYLCKDKCISNSITRNLEDKICKFGLDKKKKILSPISAKEFGERLLEGRNRYFCLT